MLLCALCYLIAALVAIVLGAKLYIKFTTGWADCYTCLAGKTAIVTGANTGIGYWTALDFAKRGARVILACRNPERAEAARDRIVKATANENVVCKQLDLHSLKSVRSFCADFNATEDRLDILVNNAGGSGFGDRKTEDGLQITMQGNYLAPFLLTHLLIDKLKQSAPSRIVNVASLMGAYGNLDLETINESQHKTMSNMKAETALYANTKQGNIMFSTELAKRLDSRQVTTYTLHPGAINTEIYRRLPDSIKTIALAIIGFLFKTPEEGAQTTIYCSVSKDLDGVTGRLYDNCKEIPIYKNCNNRLFAKKLWAKTEELVKLDENEKIK